MIDNAPKRSFQIRPMSDWCLIPLFLGHLLVSGKPRWENLIQHLIFRPRRQFKQLLLPKILWAVIHLLDICNRCVIKIMISIIRNLACGILDLKKIAQTD